MTLDEMLAVDVELTSGPAIPGWRRSSFPDRNSVQDVIASRCDVVEVLPEICHGGIYLVDRIASDVTIFEELPKARELVKENGSCERISSMMLKKYY